MASRVARAAIGAPLLRPTLAPRVVPAFATSLSTSSPRRNNVPTEEPKKKAQALIDTLPGNSLFSKTAILSSAAAGTIWVIANEIYVVNEESVVAFCLLASWTAIFKYGGPMLKEWADKHNARALKIMKDSRTENYEAVKSRVTDVKQLDGVVDMTKSLFGLSKEVAKLEAEAFELEQKAAVAAEAKAVLDSWVRYEGQVKQREQKDLAETVIAKVKKELENPKALQQILQQSVADVERILASKQQ